MFFGGMPFSFGGGGFEDARGPARPRGKVDNEGFYKLLGVAKDASEGDIKKSFRRLAMKHHPDKGGDPEEFKRISRAYEVLVDARKRAVYDEYGEEGLEGAGGDCGGGGGAADILSELFGGGRRRGGGPGGGGPRRGKDAMHPLEVSLEDLYAGRTLKLAVTRDTFCDSCNGNGATDGAGESDCRPCQGRGMVTRIAQLGPGMISQMSSPCGACKGTGRVIPEERRCRKCGGKKVASERKVVEVHIEPGMRHGSRITFRGEAGDEPGAEPGDLIFVVQQKPHPVFKRDGNDLFIEREIPLADALCGVQFALTHLDKRRLRIASAAGEVIAPGTFKCVENAGMPLPGTGGMRFGDLYIKFSVAFPASGSLGPGQLATLRAVLPAAKKSPAANYHAASGSLTPAGGDRASGSKPGDCIDEVYGSRPPAAPAVGVAAGSSSGGAGATGRGVGKAVGAAGSGAGMRRNGAGGSPMDTDADGINIREGHASPAGSHESGSGGRHGEVEEAVLMSVSPESRQARVRAQQEAAGHSSGGEAYESDEEGSGGGGGARRVQCAHQ